MKKLMALLLSLVMILGISSALADEAPRIITRDRIKAISFLIEKPP